MDMKYQRRRMRQAGRWWMIPLAISLEIPAFFVLVGVFDLISGILPGGVGQSGSTIQVTFVAISLGVYFVLFIVGFWAYIADARRLDSVGSEWVPDPGFWAIAHLFLTPHVAAPLYLVRRRQKAGIPWNQLWEWRTAPNPR